MRTLIAAFLGLDIGMLGHAASYNGRIHVADATVVQTNGQGCGWIGVAVGPMTAAFAASLGMVEPYGAIFERPEPGSPAAAANIEQGDVLTAINGSPLMHSTDFAQIISAMAPGIQVYLNTSRDGEARQVTLVLGSGPCRTSG